MLRELFTIPGLGIPIFGYGLMLVLAIISAVQLAKFLARRHGLDPETFVNLGVIGLVAGVVGARIFYLVEYWPNVARGRSGLDLLLAMVNIREGGLVFYGGLILSTVVGLWYGLRKKLPIRRSMDIAAPCMMLGLAIGRVGCLLNGCCHGDVCDSPFGVRFPYDSPAYIEHVDQDLIDPPRELLQPLPDGSANLMTRKQALAEPLTRAIAGRERSLPVHPTQIYSTVTALLACGALLAYFGIASPGQVFALMMILEGLGRFALQMLRVDPAIASLGPLPLTASGLIAAGLVAGGVVMWAAVRHKSNLSSAAVSR
jgi:phosphatidylglycerol:prolipoprotein diacylglycerol transferase